MKKISMLLLFTAFCTAYGSGQPATGTIQGTVTTSDNKPAEGVTVLVKDLNRIVLADNKGAFKLYHIPAGVHTLIVSLVSHQDVELAVTVEAGKTADVNIPLSISDRELFEVVVIANKSSFKSNRTSASLRLLTPILETPQNIQVITGKVINDQQIFDMLEGVTRNVSGATRVEHWDNYARIYMRGSQVAAFRNGMNVSTDWGPLTEDMSMIERVEFVKGPAGFMLANGNPGGFYNVVTKKPSGRNKGEVNLSLGSYNLYRAAIDVDGKLSDNGKLLYRLNVMGQLKDSYRNFDFNNRYSIVPVLKYLIDDKSSITLEYTHQFSQVNAIGANYSFSKNKYADLPRSFTTAESNIEPSNMYDNSLLAIFNHKIDENWRLTAQTAFFNYRQEGSSLWPVGFTTPGNDSLLQRGINNWDVLGLTKAGQFFVNGEAHTGAVVHRLLGGFDMSKKQYFHDWSQWQLLGDSAFNIYNPAYGVTAAPAYDRTKNIRERSVQYENSYNAFYLQDEIGLFDNRLRVTLAGRYTTLTTADPYSGSFKKSKFTPRAGLSFSVEKNTSVYFVYDQSFVENYGTDFQNKTFDPVTGSNLEVGIKRDWLNGKWNTVASAYRINSDNVLTVDAPYSTPSHTVYKSGQQQVKGAELDIRGQIVKNLDVIINYAFTEARITKDKDPKVIGNQVAGSSKHVNNAWLNYKIDRGALAGMGVSVGYQWQVDRSPWYVFDGSEFSLPDYFRLDGSLSYQKDRLGFNLVINNILDKYLYSGGPYPSSGFVYWQAEPGTNARLTVSYRF